MIIDQFTAKIDELVKFSKYSRGNLDEIWKSIKYESGLKVEIKHDVAPLEICNYAMLVNKCKIIE